MHVARMCHVTWSSIADAVRFSYRLQFKVCMQVGAFSTAGTVPPPACCAPFWADHACIDTSAFVTTDKVPPLRCDSAGTREGCGTRLLRLRAIPRNMGAETRVRRAGVKGAGPLTTLAS